MHIRLAALIVVITALLLSTNSPSKLDAEHAELTAACLGNKGSTSHVTGACTTLMDVEGLTPAYQSTLLGARGWAFYCDRQYENAIADYNQALALRSKNATAFLRRAMALDALGNSEAAVADYAKTLLIDPNNTNALLGKSEIDEKQGRFAEAVLGYERVLDIKPDSRKSGYAIAYVLNQEDGKDAVKTFLDQASMRWPEQIWAYELLVEYHLSYTSDYLGALAAVSEIDRLTSDIGTVLLLQARVHLEIGDEKKGIEYVQKLAAYQHEDDDTMKGIFIKRWFYNAVGWYLWRYKEEIMLRGHLYAVMGRPDLAVSELENALPSFGYKGRKAILDSFGKQGISVPSQAYDGSPEHLNKAISDYVLHAGRLIEPLKFHSVSTAPLDLVIVK
ncbi:tetratricopeptide repeat protein [Ruegeria atlantica]|uniref:tetratricopeptide repeat protein n=1 Tax=Ruegeria atlantica TaxID=81569 RepID=UPI001479BCA9|nr:tetratricopeptide repeat protein [Ruegeria atlantica]